MKKSKDEEKIERQSVWAWREYYDILLKVTEILITLIRMPFRSELFIIYSFNRHTHRFRSHRVKAKFGNQYILNMIDEDALLNA